MLDFKKSICTYEFSRYPVIMITKVQKLHMVVHDQQNQQETMYAHMKC